MFPENLQDREKYIEDHVISGDFDAKWTELVHESGGRRLKLNVMDDALKIDGVRVNVSAKLSQRLADLFDASMPTPLVADLMYRYAARRAAPRPMPISTSVTSMLKHSADVGKQIDVGAGLASTVGKHWVLDKQLETKSGKACNYGWHFTGPSYQGINGFPAATKEAGTNVRVIQPNATAHDPFHSDYSQICQLVSQLCWVDDVEVRFSDLLKDPILHFLVSHQGPLSIDRQPGVPKTAPILVLFPIDIIV